jgi:hypothetical protein
MRFSAKKKKNKKSQAELFFQACKTFKGKQGALVMSHVTPEDHVNAIFGDGP